MRRLAGCLGDLSTRTRRVLILRADRHSRAAVARRLGITVRRVARIERRGLHRLRSLDRTIGCRAASPHRPVAIAASQPPVATHELVTGDAPASPHHAAPEKPHPASHAQTGAVLGASAIQAPPATALAVERPDSPLPPVLMLLALVAAAAATILTILRERRRT